MLQKRCWCHACRKFVSYSLYNKNWECKECGTYIECDECGAVMHKSHKC